MASKRKLRKRECGDKRRYGTMADAARHLAWLRNLNPSFNNVGAYHCGFCGSFHLGHSGALTGGIRGREARRFGLAKSWS